MNVRSSGMYILGIIKNGSFQLEYVYRLEIANLFARKRFKISVNF